MGHLKSSSQSQQILSEFEPVRGYLHLDQHTHTLKNWISGKDAQVLRELARIDASKRSWVVQKYGSNGVVEIQIWYYLH